MSDTKYTEPSFWEKIKNFAKQAGLEVIEKALWLYFAAQRPETPVWAKTIIYSALAYFISPVDTIPDITPLIGYSDDVGILAAAIAAVSLYITDDVKEETSKKLKTWFS